MRSPRGHQAFTTERPTNAQLAELLLAGAAEEAQGSRRQRALIRCARAAYVDWPEEASEVAASGRALTELRAVGPWIEARLETWLEEPDGPPPPPPVRANFLTRSRVTTIMAGAPEWARGLRSDLQMHTTFSDGRAPLGDMVEAAARLGYEHVNITDHSQGLRIANGMDELRLQEQAGEIRRLNGELEAGGARIRVLHGLEMNLSPTGEGDMDPSVLRSLDLVLGAFHSALRRTDDQTDRYLAALRNPTFQVLAHPRGRRFNARFGLVARWPEVVAAAVERGKALEIDAYPDRQDLDVETLRLAAESGAWVSIGTDAHHPDELRFMEFGLAAAIEAGVPRDRILNFLDRSELLAWAEESRARSAR